MLEFFRTSTGNLLAAERTAGVGHHIVLSIVGADRAPDSGYMRAKVAQERMVAAGGVPYTIVRATQFFEFLGEIADSATRDGTVRVTVGQPPADRRGDLAAIVADIAEGPPTFAVVEVAGPEASAWTSWSAGPRPRKTTRGRSSPTTPQRTSGPAWTTRP